MVKKNITSHFNSPTLLPELAFRNLVPVGLSLGKNASTWTAFNKRLKLNRVFRNNAFLHIKHKKRRTN